MKTIKDSPNALKVIRIAALFVLLLVAFGCRKSKRDIAEENAIQRHGKEVQVEKDVRQRIIQTFRFLTRLRSAGKLPGISMDDHGTVSVEKMPSTLPDGRLAQEFHVVITNASPARNFYYVVAENTNNGESQLSKAWRTDPAGNVLEQYPVQ
ncbi:MAG TPA: hypothetical protein VN873_01065 [Candidatus Angelobacter sp.]|nr:hypothetical protein [Candidatus Angelobacter sp.]